MSCPNTKQGSWFPIGNMTHRPHIATQSSSTQSLKPSELQPVTKRLISRLTLIVIQIPQHSFSMGICLIYSHHMKTSIFFWIFCMKFVVLCLVGILNGWRNHAPDVAISLSVSQEACPNDQVEILTGFQLYIFSYISSIFFYFSIKIDIYFRMAKCVSLSPNVKVKVKQCKAEQS